MKPDQGHFFPTGTKAPLFIVIAACAGCATLPASDLVERRLSARIRNQTDWLDVDGHPIAAHDGGITRVGNRFYWYGSSYASNPKGVGGTPEMPWDGVSVYSSEDLARWKFEGMALTRPAWGWCSIYSGARAHVLHNERTGRYVMWFFYYINYPAVLLMVADADKPVGPFTIRGPRETGGPYGFGQDMNLFKDDDGTAYLIYDDGTRDIRVDRLTDDYMASTKNSIVAMSRRHEAPAMVKHRGKYIVAGSGVVGWNSSETHYVVSDSPMGPYGPKKCMSSGNTWNSQLTSFVYVRESDLIFAMCDCWWNPDKNDLNKSRYLWLPIAFDPGSQTARMLYLSDWNPFDPQVARCVPDLAASRNRGQR
jgi:hypothetical protein